MEMKQVILVRMDLKMPPGKLAAQVGHAAVEAALKADKDKLKEWRKQGMKKVVLKVLGINDLHKLKAEADSLGLVTALITDARRTYFDSPTTTCLGIGPDKEEEIDKITGSLKML